MLEGEEKLIRSAQKGNRECFGQLYDHYLPPIFRFIALKTNNKTIAEDLAHEVFISAFENINNYRSRGFPFSSWLYQIARNKVIDHYRTRKNNISFEFVSEEFLKTTDIVEKKLNTDFDLKAVWGAMKTLNDVEQNVLIMRFVEDLSHKEIAGSLKKSEGAIRLIQHRAINSIKNILNNKKDERRYNN